MPREVEVQFLAEFCVTQGLPLVSLKKVISWVGHTAKELPQGSNGRVFFNDKKGVVVKFAPTLRIFKSYLMEAKVM